MKRVLGFILISSVLCLLGMIFIFIRNHVLTTNNYFINFDDAEQVHELIASEFVIGESTKADVEEALANDIFGELDCLPNDIYDSRILCYALASYQPIMPMNYLIIWRFSGDKLIEIIVRVATPSAI